MFSGIIRKTIILASIPLAHGAAALADDWRDIADCGYQISQPGRYRLVSDLICQQNQPFGIGIFGDDVEVDLNGHEIRGYIAPNGFLETLGIFITNARNVRITSSEQTGRLTKFQAAIEFWENVRDSKILGNRIQIDGSKVGLLIRNSSGILVDKIQFQANTQDVSMLNSQDISFK